jgi:tubulin gamma/phosphatidylglycerol phospholipase C
MPRLVDLLEYLAQPGLEDIWVLLDIKVNSIGVVPLQESN